MGCKGSKVRILSHRPESLGQQVISLAFFHWWFSPSGLKTGEAALQALVTSPLFRERLKPDEANFVDTELMFTLSVREHRVV